MKRMGFAYDWSRELATCDPSYYRWNQWFFLQMYRRGLIYRRNASVNWCPSCETVLANEQVEGGGCWRCSSVVDQKQIPEWAFRITEYAEQLLNDLELLKESWPERITAAQANWIGRSVGAEIEFELVDGQDKLSIFTTRIDTIYGCTYLVMAPEHPLTLKLTTPEQLSEVQSFIESVKRITKIERTAEGGEKKGVFTGSYAINPFTNKPIPIWLANFVLAEYGTGAVMSVPAHDQRDFEFAKRYTLPIVPVIRPVDGEPMSADQLSAAYREYGILFGSESFDGLSSAQACETMAAYAQERSFGRPTIQYKLRDWGFSRQRYWGTPIPIIYCDKCDIQLVPEDQLPVELPAEARWTGEGASPLARDPEFVRTTCPSCGGPARRETETMDTFVDSTWYFDRYLSPHDNTQPFCKEEAKRWLPVDIYVGGPEHAVMHLLYFRFWHKVMRDLGLVQTAEPVHTLITQGMVVDWSYRCESHTTREYIAPHKVIWDKTQPRTTKDGPANKEGTPLCPTCSKPLIMQLEKMSKSKKNGVSPDEMARQYGADTLRLFVLFASPPSKDVEWSERGVEGCHRFISRIWRFFANNIQQLRDNPPYLGLANGELPENATELIAALAAEKRDLCRGIHRAIQRATDDIDKRYHFNTAIAAMMELVNQFYTIDLKNADAQIYSLLRDGCESLLLMISPFAPHIAEYLWRELGHQTSIDECGKWPPFHPDALLQDQITIVIQINGKLRGRISVSTELDPEQIKIAARNEPSIQKYLADKSIFREILIPDRLVNIVVK
jgi:leucyl-tRNA synthetase